MCVCVLDKKQTRKNDILTQDTFLDAFLQYDPLTVLWQFRLTTSSHRSFCPQCVCVCVADDFTPTIEKENGTKLCTYIVILTLRFSFDHLQRVLTHKSKTQDLSVSS